MSTVTTKRRNVRRKALIVGINDYQNPNNNLSGCVPDAMDMAETLKILGFPPTKMKLLLNEQASTEGILNGLDWLVKDAQGNDVLVFYYSGHGSQAADLDNEEHDNLDEILVPWDISWRKNLFITDDMLYEKFTKKVPRSVRTDVVLDCCFSGSATRSVVHMGFDDEPINQYRSMKQRYLPPPKDHQFRLNSMVPAFTDKKRFGDKSIIDNQNNVLLSMSSEDQVSWELGFDDGVRGVGTYYYTRILRRSNGQVSRGEAYSILRSSLAEDGYEQIPQLEVPNEEALDIFAFSKESDIDRPSEVKKRSS
jgi:hypothetical protein